MLRSNCKATICGREDWEFVKDTYLVQISSQARRLLQTFDTTDMMWHPLQSLSCVLVFKWCAVEMVCALISTSHTIEIRRPVGRTPMASQGLTSKIS
jgi:hypothetical protein